MSLRQRTKRALWFMTSRNFLNSLPPGKCHNPTISSPDPALGCFWGYLSSDLWIYRYFSGFVWMFFDLPTGPCVQLFLTSGVLKRSCLQTSNQCLCRVWGHKNNPNAAVPKALENVHDMTWNWLNRKKTCATMTCGSSKRHCFHRKVGTSLLLHHTSYIAAKVHIR